MDERRAIAGGTTERRTPPLRGGVLSQGGEKKREEGKIKGKDLQTFTGILRMGRLGWQL